VRVLPSSAHNEALDTRTAFEPVVELVASRGAAVEAVVAASTFTLTQDSRRPFRWSGDVTIPISDDALLPSQPGDLFTPFGTQLQANLGVRLADDSESTVAWGRYVVVSSRARITPDGRFVSLPLTDLGQIVADYRFENPYPVPSGDLADIVTDVIQDRTGNSPSLNPTGITISRQIIFGLSPSVDPWRELYDLVSSYGFVMYYDRDGILQLIAEPVADATDPIQIVGPTSVDIAFESRPPNLVVARGEPSDDTAPVQAVVMDNDPSSPTYAGAAPGSSPYGRITRYFASPVLTTTPEAQAAGSTILARNAAAAATYQVVRPFDPRYDPADPIAVTVGNRTGILQVDAVSIATTETTIVGRGISDFSESAGDESEGEIVG
jgi:hypothetical protein